MMKLLAYVFIGGGLGSCLRFLLSKWFNSASEVIPYGTLLANLLACVVLGFGTYWFSSKVSAGEGMKTLVLVGFCGGFSTFSTFSNELYKLMKAGGTSSLFVYATLSLVGCNLAVGLGLWLGKWIANGQ